MRKVYRVEFDRYVKADGWDDGRDSVLVDAVDVDHAEEVAREQLEGREEAHFVRWEWCGTSLVGR